MAEPIRERFYKSAQNQWAITPDWWDHDCRCCLYMPHADVQAFRARTGAASYSIRGGSRVITIRDEEIHDTHTLEEVNLWLSNLP